MPPFKRKQVDCTVDGFLLHYLRIIWINARGLDELRSFQLYSRMVNIVRIIWNVIGEVMVIFVIKGNEDDDIYIYMYMHEVNYKVVIVK